VSDIKYQIFISSTQQDLVDERRAVFETILNFGHIPVGMELFQAGNDDQWSYIKKRIMECDYYFVIVAERYGSIAPGGKSYTQMEYEFAIENKIPVAAFILSDTSSKEWSKAKVDFNQSDKLKIFKEACKTRMSRFWSNSDHLATQVAFAISEITKLFPRAGWVRSDRAANPQMLKNYDSLVSENIALREQVEAIKNEKKFEKIAQKLVELKFSQITCEYEYTNRTINIEANETASSYSIFNFLSDFYSHFVDGCTAHYLDKIFNKLSERFNGFVMTRDGFELSFREHYAYMLKICEILILLGIVENRDTQNSPNYQLTELGKEVVRDIIFND
jgi:hypothetical protein